eukprot:gene20215-biopygen23545
MTRPRYRLASGHGSGTHSWGPNPRHIGRKAGQGGSSPPGGWAGPCSWGPNPRHIGGLRVAAAPGGLGAARAGGFRRLQACGYTLSP